MGIGGLISRLASQTAEKYFIKRMMDRVTFPEARAASSLANEMIQRVYSWYSNSAGEVGSNLEAFPKDYFQLAKVLKEIFSPLTCKEFESKCLAYDKLVKRKPARHLCFVTESRLALSSAMIAEHTFKYWIEQICMALASYSFRYAAGRYREGIDPRAMQNPAFESLVGEWPRAYSPRVGDRNGMALTQISLRGPDLITAWEKCSMTEELEAMAPKQSTWSPEQPSGFPVYHATAVHLNEFAQYLRGFIVTPELRLPAQEHIDGVTPRNARIRSARTTYTPLRALLSAVFEAEVIGKMPSGSRDRPWRSGNREYEGVMLFRFGAPWSCPATYSSYVIPDGSQSAWKATASSTVVARGESTQDCWGYFSTIHGEPPGVDWPVAIHQREAAKHRTALKSITDSQIWHSAWCNSGVVRLGENITGTFAIKYIIEPDEEKQSLGGLLKKLMRKRRHGQYREIDG
ncbi:hypothetical protein BBO_00014 [Beauveria brongniartii RCEF 3172]|uniref:Uncharacterized protein n=1 Tax=Beauveria brongniartii RCEF 3172 TaxID=1081107 RepID=A0A167KTH6_9HYPO|nr:hypothetical protein BBO_00014 [Beauveria brongniartii RCEF 3172]